MLPGGHFTDDPSMVPHPERSDVPPGSLRIVPRLRACGMSAYAATFAIPPLEQARAAMEYSHDHDGREITFKRRRQ